MKKNKTTMSVPVRQGYEPVEVKVQKVTPYGILCQSGGGAKTLSADLESYNNF